MKDKRILIACIAGLVVLLGGVFLVSMNAKKTQVPVSDTTQVDEVITTVSSDTFGIELLLTPDKHRIKFVMHKITGVESVEYEAFYNATLNGNTILQGLNGEVTKDEFGTDTIESKYRELGTCSTGGKCRFDEGVTSVKFTFKIRQNGKTVATNKSIDL